MTVTIPALLAAFLALPPPAAAVAPPLVMPVASEPYDASVYAGPSLIRTEGVVGETLVRGTFSRMSDGRWREQNDATPGAWTFHTMEQTETLLTLFDSARGVWIRIDLEARTVSYRDGNGGGDYAPLYGITDVR